LKKNIRGLLFILFITVTSQHVIAQEADDEFLRSEIGIDVANALTFLKRNNQSYLLNFNYYLNRKVSARAGLNLDIGSDDADGVYPSVRLGVQNNNRTEHWNLYYGIDFSYSYSKANAQPKVLTRWGVGPLIGVEYFYHKRLSVATEASLNYYHFKEKDLDTFDPIKERTYYRLLIGSVGMASIKYHF
jgi:hypothetical protein